MPSIAQNIKHLRENKRWTKKEMSEILGITSYTTITKWEKGENHPRGKEIKQLCELFNVSADYLLGIESINESDRINYYKYYPVAVSAGVLENIDSVTRKDIKMIPMTNGMMGKYAGSNDVFFVDINGTSMNKVIAPGSKICIKPIYNFESLKDGDIVLFSKDGEFSIKRFYNDIENIRMIFRPESTDKSHLDIVIPYAEMHHVKFYGKVVVNIAQFY